MARKKVEKEDWEREDVFSSPKALFYITKFHDLNEGHDLPPELRTTAPNSPLKSVEKSENESFLSQNVLPRGRGRPRSYVLMQEKSEKSILDDLESIKSSTCEPAKTTITENRTSDDLESVKSGQVLSRKPESKQEKLEKLRKALDELILDDSD